MLIAFLDKRQLLRHVKQFGNIYRINDTFQRRVKQTFVMILFRFIYCIIIAHLQVNTSFQNNLL